MIASMDVQMILIFCILIFVCLGAGYAFGRRRGIRQGVAKGQALDQIRLRAMAYEQGCCPICQSEPAAPGTDSRGKIC